MKLVFRGDDTLLSLTEDRVLRSWRIPDLGPDAIWVDSGAVTNLRVCRRDLRVVPISPFPAADVIWAPTSACDPDE